MSAFVEPDPQRLASGQLANERPEHRELLVNTHRAQDQLAEGTWQASDTPHGEATPLLIQPDAEEK